jgi:Flp pilus assembly pilin Flp
MAARFRKVAQRIFPDEKGASVIELGAIVPLLSLLIVGVVDLSMGFSHRLGLEAAAERTLENGISKGLVNSSFSYLQAEAATAAGVSQNNVTIDAWLECDGTRQTNYSDVCASGQQIARYLSVRIADTFHPIIAYTPFAAFYGGSTALGNNVSMTGDAVARVQ